MASTGLASGLGGLRGLGLGGTDGQGVLRRVTRLCPNCGIRRPIQQFVRFMADGSRDIGVNCAFCRGVRPPSPARNGGNGQDIVLDGKQLLSLKLSPQAACDLWAECVIMVRGLRKACRITFLKSLWVPTTMFHRPFYD